MQDPMNTSKLTNWMKAKRRIAVSALALALVGGAVSYEIAKPGVASAAPSPSSAPLEASQVEALMSLDKAMETVAARVTPAIVNVAVTSKQSPKQNAQFQGEGDDDEGQMQQFFGPMGRQFGPFGGHMQQQQPQIEHGIGSGVIISPDGYIITNNHVVQGATDIRVTLNDRRILPAKLVGTDPLSDLAVIKIEGSNIPNEPHGDTTH